MEVILDKYNEIFSYSGFANHSIPWYMENPHRHTIPWAAVVVYVILLYILPKILPQKGYNVKSIMKWWNLFLSIMSGCVVVCCGGSYILKMREFGAMTLFCDKEQISYRSNFLFYSQKR
jgi:hypothetical protein